MTAPVPYEAALGTGARFVFTPDMPGWLTATQSPRGIVARDLRRRGVLVHEAARQRIRLGHVAGGPGTRRIAQRNLRDTGRVAIGYTGGTPVAVVGFYKFTALMHHEGTRPHLIVPRNAKVLAFWSNPAGKMVFARRVHHPGTKPNHYLTDNLYLAVQ